MQFGVWAIAVFALLSGCSVERPVRAVITSFDQVCIVGYADDHGTYVLSRAYVAGVLEMAEAIRTAPADAIDARCFYVGFLDDAQPLLARAHERRWPMASVTKLMTAIVVAEHFDREQVIPMTDAIVATEGAVGEFVVHEEFVCDDLLAAMLVGSSNDAAEAFAQTYGRDAFIRLMNEKAAELRMFDTTYADPSGLSDLGLSTPRDLFTLIAFVHAQHDELLAITARPSVVISDVRFDRARSVSSTNAFTRTDDALHGARAIDFVGGKTGYTTAAIGNLVSLFSVDGRMLAIVVMGSRDRFGDTHRLLARAVRNTI